MPKIAIVGAGVAGSGVVKGLAQQAENLAQKGVEIHVFDKSQVLGVGSPYNEKGTDPEELMNVMSQSGAVPEGDKFVAWIREHKDEIRARFRKIFETRWEERGVPQSHRKAVLDSFEKRYLNFETGLTFHPRILYGFYSEAKFRENVETLKRAGVVVVEHPGSEIQNVDELRDFDHVVVSTGLQHKGQDLDGDVNGRYLAHTFPSHHIRKRFDYLSQQGASDFKIAIEGTSLSAIDVVKVALQDYGYFREKSEEPRRLEFVRFDHDKKIRVDMISRNGVFSAVKCEGVGLRDRVKKYNPISQQNIDDLAAKNGGKICLWQAIELVIERIKDAYVRENEESPNKATEAKVAALRGFLEVIKEHGRTPPQTTNYQPIFQVMSNLASRGKSDAFEILETHLSEAEKGDAQVPGDLIWQMVYTSFDGVFIGKYLSAEDRILRFKIFDRLHRIHAESMPPESARELLALHEAGVLFMEAKAITKRTVDEKKVCLEGVGKYDLVVSALGHEYNINNVASPFFRELIQKKIIRSDKVEFCLEAQYEEKIAALAKSLGADTARKVEGFLAKDGDRYVYDVGLIVVNESFQPISGDRSITDPRFRFITQTGGISSAEVKYGMGVAGVLLREVGIVEAPKTSASFSSATRASEKEMGSRT